MIYLRLVWVRTKCQWLTPSLYEFVQNIDVLLPSCTSSYQASTIYLLLVRIGTRQLPISCTNSHIMPLLSLLLYEPPVVHSVDESPPSGTNSCNIQMIYIFLVWIRTKHRWFTSVWYELELNVNDCPPPCTNSYKRSMILFPSCKNSYGIARVAPFLYEFIQTVDGLLTSCKNCWWNMTSYVLLAEIKEVLNIDNLPPCCRNPYNIPGIDYVPPSCTNPYQISLIAFLLVRIRPEYRGLTSLVHEFVPSIPDRATSCTNSYQISKSSLRLVPIRSKNPWKNNDVPPSCKNLYILPMTNNVLVRRCAEQ